jgi:hypothetical protein
VTRRDVAGIASAFDERFSFSRRDRLHDDSRLLPSIKGGAGREREQHVLSARQQLRAIGLFTVLDAHEHVRCAAIRGDSHDAFDALAEDETVLPPADAERGFGRANRHGRTARHRNFLDRPIRGGVKGHRLAVRREDRLCHELIAFGSPNQVHVELGHRPEIEPGFRHIRQHAVRLGRARIKKGRRARAQPAQNPEPRTLEP